MARSLPVYEANEGPNQALPQLPAVFRRHPSLFLAGVVVMSLGVWAAVIGSIWYAHGIVVSVPGVEELRRIGSTDQATTIFDATDKPAFTIFKEQRIEVPLDAMSPTPRQRRDLASRISASTITAASTWSASRGAALEQSS